MSLTEKSQQIEEPDIEVDTSNADRVKFTLPVVKQIVSPHSGSILSQDDPLAPLDEELKLKAVSIFSETVGESANVNKTSLLDMLKKVGFDATEERLQAVINKHHRGSEDLSEGDWLDFVQRFNAPEYYFGQRLRRNAGRGQLAEVVELLVRNCDVNCGDGEGLTSLHYASEFNQVNIIKALSDTVPKGKLIVDCQDKYGWTPLYCAAHHGNLEVVKLLMDMGANPLVKNSVGKNVLHAACAQNRTTIVDHLLKVAAPTSTDKALLTAQDSQGMTPLHEAAFQGHSSLYNILSRHAAADPSIRDTMNYTAADYNCEFVTPQPAPTQDLPRPPPNHQSAHGEMKGSDSVGGSVRGPPESRRKSTQR